MMRRSLIGSGMLAAAAAGMFLASEPPLMRPQAKHHKQRKREKPIDPDRSKKKYLLKGLRP